MITNKLTPSWPLSICFRKFCWTWNFFQPWTFARILKRLKVILFKYDVYQGFPPNRKWYQTSRETYSNPLISVFKSAYDPPNFPHWFSHWDIRRTLMIIRMNSLGKCGQYGTSMLNLFCGQPKCNLRSKSSVKIMVYPWQNYILNTNRLSNISVGFMDSDITLTNNKFLKIPKVFEIFRL